MRGDSSSYLAKNGAMPYRRRRGPAAGQRINASHNQKSPSSCYNSTRLAISPQREGRNHFITNHYLLEIIVITALISKYSESNYRWCRSVCWKLKWLGAPLPCMKWHASNQPGIAPSIKHSAANIKYQQYFRYWLYHGRARARSSNSASKISVFNSKHRAIEGE